MEYKFEITIETNNPEIDRVAIIQRILSVLSPINDINVTIIQKPNKKINHD